MEWRRSPQRIDRSRVGAATGPVSTGVAGFLLAAALTLAGCRLGDAEAESYFDIEADSALTGYTRVTVQLQDSLGGDRATLFDESLRTLDRLRRLPAGPYRGEAARIVIMGYQGDRPRYRETRHYAGAIQSVLAVDIFLWPSDSAEIPAAGRTPPRNPVLAGWLRDTVISIRDSIGLWAEVTDADGDLAGYGFDCDGDGKIEDSAAVSGPRAGIVRGMRFPDTGSFGCDLKIWDVGRRPTLARIKVRVELDLPRADAGEDTAVVAGSRILLHAGGDDRFGPIVTREWKLGAKPFVPVPQIETVHPAPSEPGTLTCILRVTDSDGFAALDTVLVTVIPRTSAP
jgi:hypothetical protein